MQLHFSSKRRGFTLIELLVVIAIIAVLASILFPVFASAKSTAQKTSCMSNMKQLANGINLYKGDWSGWYPFGGGKEDTSDRSMEWQNVIFKYVKSTKVYRCPSSRLPDVNSANPADFGSNIAMPRTPVTYLYNGFIGIDDLAYQQGSLRTHFEGQIERLTRCALLMEGFIKWGSTLQGRDPLGQTSLWLRPYHFRKKAGDGMTVAYKAPWHVDGGNVAFCDGHIRYFRYNNYRTLEQVLPWSKHVPVFTSANFAETDKWNE